MPNALNPEGGEIEKTAKLAAENKKPYL